MHGPDFQRPDPQLIEALDDVSVASITTALSRRGIRDIWMPLKPLFPGMRMVGPALTLRSIPGRTDMEHLAMGDMFQRHPFDVHEALQPGDVLVHDGMGLTTMGLFGDLLTMSLQKDGGAGLVTDMAIRDGPNMVGRSLPIFCRGTAGPGGRVYNIDYNVPIGCAGVAVFPGDIVVGDDDGVAVIPQAMLADVVEDILNREDRDTFIREKLMSGTPVRGLYPIEGDLQREFEAWLKAKGKRD